MASSSVFIESNSGLDADLLCANDCSRFLLLCSFSFKCALICALNSVRSVYCFPQIVQVEGFSGDIRDDDECNEEEDSAKEDADSASEQEDAAGEAAMAGEEGDEEDDMALDCKLAARLIVAEDLTGVTAVPSSPSGMASIGFPSRKLFAIDLADEAFTTRWTKRSCCPPTVVVVVPPIIAPAIGEESFAGPGDAHFIYLIR